MRFLWYFNWRTFAVLFLSALSCYVSIHFQFKIHFDVVLFGLALAFPLGTSIQTAFKRRERALEYLSLFKAGMTAVFYSFQSSKGLTPELKAEGRNFLLQASEKLFLQLKNSDGDMTHFQLAMDKLMTFIEQNRGAISGRIIIRIIRYVKESLEGAAFLLSLVRHRTMTGLRFYSLSFIHVYAIVQAPMMVYEFDNQLPNWAVYFAAALGTLILITLYNFQQQIEFPFDQKGLDDIKLDDFKLNI